MRKEKCVKKLVMGMAVAMLTYSAASIQTVASTSASIVEEVIDRTESGSFYSASYVWITKTINGVKYKRLYDIEHNIWLTDWIKCP